MKNYVSEANNPEIDSKKRLISKTRFRLNKNKFLVYDIITETHDYTRKKEAKEGVVNESVIKNVTVDLEKTKIPLKEVSNEQLLNLRQSGTPGFVLKKDGHYYYAKIPADFNLANSNMLGPNRCSNNRHECIRLKQEIDSEGGCQKAIKKLKGIEKNEYIIEGYESFNTYFDSLVVSKCKCFL